MTRARDGSWRGADANVAIGAVMADYLAARGLDKARIHPIANWADEEELCPLEPEENELRLTWGYGPTDCVVGHSGNLGRAHDVATMQAAIAGIDGDDETRIRFLFIGGGARLADIRRSARTGRRDRIRFEPYQPRQHLRQSLSVPDIHWLSLDPALEGLIVPSKFYGAAAIGRPIIFIGDPVGEIARLIAEGECGKSFHPGEAGQLVRYLRALEADARLRRKLGANARTFCEARLGRSERLREWRELLHDLAQG
jgi:glycosyltransferase involved in cell wall biosynthesis